MEIKKIEKLIKKKSKIKAEMDYIFFKREKVQNEILIIHQIKDSYKRKDLTKKWEKMMRWLAHILKKALRICKLILKNEHNLNNFNDYVKNELRPHDY